MQEGPAESRIKGGKKPRRPGRMTWLSFIMLVFGGRLMIDGMTSLQDLGVEKIEEADAAAVTAGNWSPLTKTGQEALVRAANDAMQSIDSSVLGVHAVGQCIYGLLLLLSVAAIFSSDPRGGISAILAAWFGVVYNIGNGLFSQIYVRAEIMKIAPLWISVTTGESGSSSGALSEESQIGLVGGLITGSVLLVAAVGIGFSIILLKYFKGKNSRKYFSELRALLMAESSNQARGR